MSYAFTNRFTLDLSSIQYRRCAVARSEVFGRTFRLLFPPYSIHEFPETVPKRYSLEINLQ